MVLLDEAGWEADDIESAGEALYEACDEGAYSGADVAELRVVDVNRILDVEIDEAEAQALLVIASVLSEHSHAAVSLRRALFDLDAFVYGSDEEE